VPLSREELGQLRKKVKELTLRLERDALDACGCGGHERARADWGSIESMK
jgi:hypothetical protein